MGNITKQQYLEALSIVDRYKYAKDIIRLYRRQNSNSKDIICDTVESIEGENWIDLPNFEGVYQISDLGRVKSLRRYADVRGGGQRIIKEKILKHGYTQDGYQCVSLSINGKQSVHLLHRLVLSSFSEINKDRIEVNHINGIRSDNRLFNLEWCNRSDNIMHSYHTLENRRNAKLVFQFTTDGKFVAEYYGCGDASRAIGISSKNINKCRLGKQKTAGGFIWKSYK